MNGLEPRLIASVRGTAVSNYHLENLRGVLLASIDELSTISCGY